MGPTERLVEYALGLKYDDLPADVVEMAKFTIADGVAAMIFGHELPWSQKVVAYAKKYGEPGRGGSARVFGEAGHAFAAPAAALANGALAHAFEMDGATKPSFGAHPCGTIFPATLALAQERGCDGRAIISAFVAATEVMVRIARATRKTNERRGFHGPGTTGPFGAAVGGGRVLGLDATQMTNALGIAASLACGLVQFTRSGTGAMVKRLHFGRANESGVLAAVLAEDGFTGPHDAIEGDLGFLHAFCDETDVAALTRGLGAEYATRTIYMKRFACHGSAQAPLQALEELREEHRFGGDDVVEIEITGNEDRVDRHNQLEPEDPMLAQYSVPFSVALGCYRDARDPRSFDQSALEDGRIRALTRNVHFVLSSDPDELHSEINTLTIRLKDGRTLNRRAETFIGTPKRPAKLDDVFAKFSILTDHCDRSIRDDIFDRIMKIENEKSMDWLAI